MSIRDRNDVEELTLHNIERQLKIVQRVAQEQDNKEISDAMQTLIGLYEGFSHRRRAINNQRIDVVNQLNRAREHNIMVQHFFRDVAA